MKISRIKVIIDTNLWISYLITKGFKRIDDLIYKDEIELIFSQKLIDEFVEVANRPKFKKYFKNQDVIHLLEIFDSYGKLYEVNSEVDVCRDKKDNFLLSLATDSKADYLITGDSDLLELKKYGKTTILTISAFESLS